MTGSTAGAADGGRHAQRRIQRTAAPRIILCVLASLTVACGSGCSAYPRVPCPPRVTPALGVAYEDHAAIEVMYATDRAFRRDGEFSEKPRRAVLAPRLYGIERSDHLKLGTCTVTIPSNHCQGVTETPGLLVRPDRSKHVTLTDIAEPFRTDQDFIAALRMRVNPPGGEKKPILIYIHGFSTTFEDAAIITAQIAHDIGFDGVPIVYSWPTRGSLLSYLVDSVNAEWSTGFLIGFLDLLVEQSNAEHIHLIAFSMGNRILTNGIKNYLAQRALRDCETIGTNGGAARRSGESQPPPFGQVILAAADMDARIFERDYAPYLARAAERITIYVSAADWALGGAQRLHNYSRLGQRPLPNVDLRLLVDRIDVVDVTEVDRDFFGHYYSSQSPEVLRDMQRVLSGHPAESPQRGLQRQFFYRLSADETTNNN